MNRFEGWRRIALCAPSGPGGWILAAPRPSEFDCKAVQPTFDSAAVEFGNRRASHAESKRWKNSR